jgi:hypothetical protein
MSNISQRNVERRKELFTLILSRKTDKELAHLCRTSSGRCTVYAVCPDAKEGRCPLKAMCGNVDESHWSEVRAMVEKKEDNKLKSVEHEDQPKKVEAPFPLIDSSFLDEGIDSYKSLFEENLVEGLARQCNDLNGYSTCPLANSEAPCPFGSNKWCSEIIKEDWKKLKSYVLEKTKSSDVNQKNMEREKTMPDFSDIKTIYVNNNLDDYKNLLKTVSFANPAINADHCRRAALDRTGKCQLSERSILCPFNTMCSKMGAEQWENLAMYVKEKEEANMQRETNIQREAHTQEINTQEDIVQETKESPVRCYYAFMVKEEKIIFYKGVFTRRKTVPVAFTAESQRDLFVRNYECSYAVSRRQLLHELADAYQDRSITELSRVISEIRRRAISATENSNGAITYSDYLYFDMAEIVFDI